MVATYNQGRYWWRVDDDMRHARYDHDYSQSDRRPPSIAIVPAACDAYDRDQVDDLYLQ